MKKSPTHLTTLSLALSVGLAISTSLPVTATSPNSSASNPQSNRGTVLAQRQTRPGVRRSRLNFIAPNVRGTGNLEGGAARGGNTCSQDSKAKALLPQTLIGLTTSASPKFFVYLDKTSAPKAEFILTDPDNDGQIVYETTLSIPNKSGVISFGLPENSSKLEAGKKYHWSFAVICDASDRAADIVVEGDIQRVATPPSLAQALKGANPADRPILYANEGMWFDALKSLAELRAASPNNPDFAADWQALLESAELREISQAPVIGLESSNNSPL